MQLNVDGFAIHLDTIEQFNEWIKRIFLQINNQPSNVITEWHLVCYNWHIIIGGALENLLPHKLESIQKQYLLVWLTLIDTLRFFVPPICSTLSNPCSSRNYRIEDQPSNRGLLSRIAPLTLILWQIRDRSDLGATLEQVPTILDPVWLHSTSCDLG